MSSVFELLSCTDDEIELISSALSCRSQSNQVNLQSERGQQALTAAISLVNAGVKAPEEIAATLDARFTQSRNAGQANDVSA
ncbi:hypothetical protein HGP14_34755 [Rhizobium sp. P32RR-XVIII]|uniref:hypothetical protein n=1 Tax=Rhizobium sp. P32RR-XVIII TaxID=2726738 RepID=UPI0014575D8A|nr:hypothetical protein [Rhizobium sp. P32RR-XVIII]NLS08341.1 hypothetical protein [Rhizobium sp. P32RR-XVIII]